jgi:hypothetical protein
MSDFSGDEANGEWYHTLDIYNVNIGVAENGKLSRDFGWRYFCIRSYFRNRNC